MRLALLAPYIHSSRSLRLALCQDYVPPSIFSNPNTTDPMELWLIFFFRFNSSVGNTFFQTRLDDAAACQNEFTTEALTRSLGDRKLKICTNTSAGSLSCAAVSICCLSPPFQEEPKHLLKGTVALCHMSPTTRS